MTKIKLQEIAINNFKGIRFLKLNMEGKDSNIQGANGSGKTTIYKAYFWCITGKTLEPNETVQTLDQDNNIVHKIETSVVLTLLIDDSYEVTLERKLVEKWRALGMPDEQFTGTEQKRFFNEIPLSNAEFNAKLNTICDLDKWVLLSNINTFMSLKVEDRRKMLMDMAGEVNEEELMKPYTAVERAVNVEKKSVEELQKQTLSTKKRSNDELKTIPSQIDAQDRLKVNADFSVISKERDKIQNEIADVERLLEGSTEELEASKAHREKVQKLREKYDAAVKDWNLSYNKSIEIAEKDIAVAKKELEEAQKEKKEHTESLVNKATLLKEKEEQFELKKEEWNKVNQRTFTEETLTACPTCGHIFTEEEKATKTNLAIEHFNADKSKLLKVLLDEAGVLKQQILVLTGDYNEAKQIIAPQIETRVNAKETAFNEKVQALASLKLHNIDTDGEILALKKELEKAEANAPSVANDDSKNHLRAKKQELTARRDELTKILAGEDTNNRIEDEKKRLNARATELAQIVADCDNTLYQIMEYKKAKVATIEDKINGLFQLARWRFFKKNIGNDDYSEVCECLHNGVDYNSTNAADKINLGVDIVASIGKAYGLEVPVWVDFRESVADLLEVDTQVISLEHIPNAPLTLNN